MNFPSGIAALGVATLLGAALSVTYAKSPTTAQVQNMEFDASILADAKTAAPPGVGTVSGSLIVTQPSNGESVPTQTPLKYVYATRVVDPLALKFGMTLAQRTRISIFLSDSPLPSDPVLRRTELATKSTKRQVRAIGTDLYSGKPAYRVLYFHHPWSGYTPQNLKPQFAVSGIRLAGSDISGRMDTASQVALSQQVGVDPEGFEFHAAFHAKLDEMPEWKDVAGAEAAALPQVVALQKFAAAAIQADLSAMKPHVTPDYLTSIESTLGLMGPEAFKAEHWTAEAVARSLMVVSTIENEAVIALNKWRLFPERMEAWKKEATEQGAPPAMIEEHLGKDAFLPARLRRIEGTWRVGGLPGS